MLQFWPLLKKMAKVTPYLGKYALLTPNIREMWYFDPLSSQKVAIMPPILGHVAPSQQFWDEGDQKCNFF